MTPRRPSPAAFWLFLALPPAASPAVAAVQVPAGFVSEALASGLDDPTGFAFLPDGRLLVVEQRESSPNDNEGHVHLVTDGAVTGPVLVIPDVNAEGNERGLLGAAVDAAWPSKPYAYFYFTGLDGKNHVRRYTGAGDLSDGSSTNLSFAQPYEVIDDLRDDFEWHNGGTLRFGPDGMLYVSQGDDAMYECAEAQNPSVWLGVILRLDVSSLPPGAGGPPAKSAITPSDNPLPGPDENERLVFAYGFRNPFRFTIDPLTSMLYIGDVGETEREELDASSGGENFGWPLLEGTLPYPPGASCVGLAPGVDPIAEYAHDGQNPWSIIAGPCYRRVLSGGLHNFPAAFEGNAFYHDFYDGKLVRLIENGGGWSVAPPEPGQPEPGAFATGLEFVSDVQVGPDGAIYYLQRFASSFLGRIRPDPVVTVSDGAAPLAPVFVAAPNPARIGDIVRFRTELPFDGREGVVLDLFDAGGRHVHRTNARGTWPSWRPQAGFPAGVYRYRASSRAGRFDGTLVVLP